MSEEAYVYAYENFHLGEESLEFNGDLLDITRGVRGGVSVLVSVYHRRVRQYTFFLSSFLLL